MGIGGGTGLVPSNCSAPTAVFTNLLALVTGPISNTHAPAKIHARLFVFICFLLEILWASARKQVSEAGGQPETTFFLARNTKQDGRDLHSKPSSRQPFHRRTCPAHPYAFSNNWFCDSRRRKGPQPSSPSFGQEITKLERLWNIRMDGNPP